LAKIITVANQKGGVGKTTLVKAIGNYKRLEGYNVLFIDLDQQSNLTWALGADPADDTPDAYDVIMKGVHASRAIIHTEQGDLIQSGADLLGIDTELQAIETGREARLKKALHPIKHKYDYILIDTPPQSSNIVINALTASDYLLIPAKASVFSIQAIGQLDDLVQLVRTYTNKGLDILGIVINLHDSRTNLEKEIIDMAEAVAARLDTTVFTSTLRRAIAIEEAHANQTSIFEYAPRAKVTADLKKLIDELNI